MAQHTGSHWIIGTVQGVALGWSKETGQSRDLETNAGSYNCSTQWEEQAVGLTAAYIYTHTFVRCQMTNCKLFCLSWLGNQMFKTSLRNHKWLRDDLISLSLELLGTPETHRNQHRLRHLTPSPTFGFLTTQLSRKSCPTERASPR